MIDYLYTMITPMHVGGESLLALDLASVDFAVIPDEHYHGVIAHGEPTPEQTEQLWRILRPGGHVMLIAPDHCLTGHVGACSLEDGGFEIRDAILYAGDPGDGERMHYVPKASGKERNAGCEHLPSGNDHPTVKPVAVLRRVLRDVPADSTVLDPFMGSGSLALACMQTGHDYVGIEKEQPYFDIAKARVRHLAGVGATATDTPAIGTPDDSGSSADLMLVVRKVEVPGMKRRGRGRSRSRTPAGPDEPGPR